VFEGDISALEFGGLRGKAGGGRLAHRWWQVRGNEGKVVITRPIGTTSRVIRAGHRSNDNGDGM
jgi:hypothetical protein